MLGLDNEARKPKKQTINKPAAVAGSWTAAEDESLRSIVRTDGTGSSGWEAKATDFNALGGRQVTGDGLRHRWYRLPAEKTSYRELQAELKRRGLKASGSTETLRMRLSAETQQPDADDAEDNDDEGDAAADNLSDGHEADPHSTAQDPPPLWVSHPII